jgi:Domain of unknown function (DUF1905)/Bacteriocin-protection, YdeI or OmpD-Associated
MISFEAIIQKFAENKDKTGWTYIDIPAKIAKKIKPETKKSFRVKGTLDQYKINATSILPMGEGDFILPLNATMRKGIKKIIGEKISVSLMEDPELPKLSEDLLNCLQDEPLALKNFNSLTASHQRYYSNWIESAKTDDTKAKRITQAMKGLALGLAYNEMMHLDK